MHTNFGPNTSVPDAAFSSPDPSMSPDATELSPFRIAFGAGQNGVFHAGLPVLAGDSTEDLFSGARPAGQSGVLTLFRMDDWLLGAATLPLHEEGLEAASLHVYRDILQATRGLHLARIWNYVPAINEAGPEGLENYRLFCRGRSVAFEQEHGSDFNALLPSASAVGCGLPALTVCFAASGTMPRHIENPLQVPAYNYPAEYGPRSPSFARATILRASGEETVFISGTAAIRGHVTVAPHDLRGQLDCTMENLKEISRACGLGSDLNRGAGTARHFKVYLRHASYQSVAAGRLERDFVTPDDRVSYLQADICRAQLLVEIEATLFGVKAG